MKYLFTPEFPVPSLVESRRVKYFSFAVALIVGAGLVSAPLHAQPLPSVTSGALLLQLKADAGVTTDGTGTNVTSWTDQSANGFSFNTDANLTSRFYPVLITNGQAGLPVVRFAANCILRSTSSIQLFQSNNSPLTIFTAFTSTANNAQRYLVNYAVIPVSGFTVTMELGVDAGARGAGNYGLHRGGSDTTFTTNNTISNNVFNVMSTVIKSTGSAPNNVAIYKNGDAQTLGGFYSSGNPQYPGWLSAGQYQVGAYELDIGGRFTPATSAYDSFHLGDIAEVIIYQGELSLQDRAAVENYLGSKYTVTITAPPSLLITAQPRPQAVTNGQPATFTVAAGAANGDAISYQWQINGTNLNNATDASFTIPSVVATNIGSYQCVVSIPSATNTSASAQLRLYTNTFPNIGSGSLLVHLQADAGVVTNASGGMTTWFDQSSNSFEFDTTANSVTTFYPTPTTGVSGNQAIHFEGAHNVSCSVPVQLFTDTNSPLTVFAACSVLDNSVQRYLFNSKVPRVARAFNEMEVGPAAGNRNVPGSFGIHRAAGGASVTAANVVTNNQINAMTLIIKSNGAAPANIEVYQNGNYLPVSGFAASSPTAPYTEVGWLSAGHYQTGSYPLYVGVGADSSSAGFSGFGYWFGDISELIIFQGQLLPADRALVESYLGQKYGLAITAPPALTMAAQPQTVAITNGGGQSATFTASANSSTGATNFTYQWIKNGTNIANATGSSLTISPATIANIGTYQCVISFSGSSVTSATAQLRLLPDVALPAVTSGSLLVDLAADTGVVAPDGTNVTAWFDQSTNAFEFDAQADFAATFPPIITNGSSGNRVIRFAGNNDLLCGVPVQLFTDTNSPLTIFTAFSTQDSTSQRYLVNSEVVPRVGRLFNELMLGTDAGNRGAGNFGLHRAAGGVSIAPTNTINTNQFYAMSLVIRSNGAAPANIQIYENGNALPVTGIPPGSPADSDAGWLSAGDYPTGSYELHIGTATDSGAATGGITNTYVGPWLGDIGEVVIYQGQLSDPDRAAVEAYLTQKYGLAPPQVQIALNGTNAVVSYPVSEGTTTAGTYILQSTPSLLPATWTTVAPAPAASGTQYSVTNGLTGQRYYRLQQKY